MPMPEAVIVATGRTPIGRANKGSLTEWRPDDLSALIIKAVLAKVPELDPQSVDDLILGCAQPAGESGYNIARVTALLAGMPDVPGVTVNRYCSSSLQAIRMAAHAIKAGEGHAFICAGVETVSRFQFGASDRGPHNELFADAEARSNERAQGASSWEPPTGLPDIYIAMGQTAENVRLVENVTRREMDEFAALSQQRAVRSQHNGFFEREITPVTNPDGTVVAKDDGPRDGTTAEKLAELKPAFRPDGEITAGNACPLNDGAAAVIVMSDTKAAELGITPMARIVASGVTGLNPEIMGMGPVGACRQALDRAGMSISEIDLVEINEAFAAQVIPSAKHLGIPWDKLNVNGGGIALGHPFGMTGARIMTTLINGLEDADKTFGMESMCVGGGQGVAMICVERASTQPPHSHVCCGVYARSGPRQPAIKFRPSANWRCTSRTARHGSAKRPSRYVHPLGAMAERRQASRRRARRSPAISLARHTVFPSISTFQPAAEEGVELAVKPGVAPEPRHGSPRAGLKPRTGAAVDHLKEEVFSVRVGRLVLFPELVHDAPDEHGAATSTSTRRVRRAPRPRGASRDRGSAGHR